MGLASVENSIKAMNRAQQEIETFGHLAPKLQTLFKIDILFTYTAYGRTEIIDCVYEDGLEDSPWLFSDMNEFTGDWCFKNDEVGVFKFNGKYKKFKNGNCKFYGKPKQIEIEFKL